MNDEKHTVGWMILFGVIRHVLTALGTFLVARGLIDADTNERLVSEGTTQVVGWVLIAIPFVWSWLQKQQVWGWVRTALKLPAATKPADVVVAAPGPDKPI